MGEGKLSLYVFDYKNQEVVSKVYISYGSADIYHYLFTFYHENSKNKIFVNKIFKV